MKEWKTLKKLMFASIASILLVFAAAACGGGKDNSGNNASSGKASASEIFQQNCAACHGKNLEGKNGPNLQKIGSKLTKDQILNQIKNGGGGMPANIISGKDAEAVAEWLANKK
jgi:cytochrome c551